LASDIDNTLTGDVEALKRLGQQLATLRAQGRLALFLITGRTLAEVLNGFEQENIPQADAIITQVGTEIYLPPFSPDMTPLPEWDTHLRRQFSRQQAVAFLDGIEGAAMQPDHYNTPLKASFYLDQAPDPNHAAVLVQLRVAEAGDAYQVVWSSGKHLDILPAAAGKANAVHFLISHLDLAPERVVAAGDSGNDRSMLEELDYGIIVANAQPELKRLQADRPPTHLYFARQPFAAGVEEGLRHLGVL
jgi:sucrose-6F-phosphate phosphohydrolase